MFVCHLNWVTLSLLRRQRGNISRIRAQTLWEASQDVQMTWFHLSAAVRDSFRPEAEFAHKCILKQLFHREWSHLFSVFFSSLFYTIIHIICFSHSFRFSCSNSLASLCGSSFCLFCDFPACDWVSRPYWFHLWLICLTCSSLRSPSRCIEPPPWHCTSSFLQTLSCFGRFYNRVLFLFSAACCFVTSQYPWIILPGCFCALDFIKFL